MSTKLHQLQQQHTIEVCCEKIRALSMNSSGKSLHVVNNVILRVWPCWSALVCISDIISVLPLHPISWSKSTGFRSGEFGVIFTTESQFYYLFT